MIFTILSSEDEHSSIFFFMLSFLSRPTKALLFFCIAAFLSGLYFDIHALRLITKGVPLIILSMYAWRYPKRDLAMCGAFVFSLLGDIVLELPNVLPFALGLGLFLIAHLFFIRAFFKRAHTRILWPLLPIVTYCGSIYSVMLSGLGPLLIPVAVYVLVIAIMLWRASIYAIETKQFIPLFGAILFAISDSLIGINRFALEFEGARYAIILTYWMAQFSLFHIILSSESSPKAQS